MNTTSKIFLIDGYNKSLFVNVFKLYIEKKKKVI